MPSSSDQSSDPGRNGEFGVPNGDHSAEMSSMPSDSPQIDRAVSIPHSALRTPHSEEVCPECKGAGWLRMEVPIGDPRFGRLYPCICRTNAREESNLEELYKLSNLDVFQEKVFVNFNAEIDSSTEEAYNIARDYARTPEGWLVLLGGYGSGKSHLAAAIANHLVQDHRMQVYFTVAPDLLDYLRAAYAPNSGVAYDERFEQIRSTYLLIIDDLGAEQTTAWASEKLYQIFNHRYNHRLPTVVTSNCDLDTLDPRVRSRLCDPDLCRHVFLQCGDYRMRRMDPRFMGQYGGNSNRAPQNRQGQRGGYTKGQR